MKQFFLPIGLILASLIGFVLPAGGVFFSDNNGLTIFVFIIFLISGYQAGSEGLGISRQLPAIFLIAAAISLFLAPLLGLGISMTLKLPLEMTMGLILMCTVPPTISSGVVITEVAGGNGSLALFLTISLNLLGMFTMPFVLDLSLKAAGPIEINQYALLFKMLLFVLLPFIIGKMVRKLGRKKRVSSVWSYVNSSCVIVIVYASIAASKDTFTGLTVKDCLLVFTGVTSAHCLLLAMSAQAGKIMKLPERDNKALIFVTSQKTMAVALAVLASLQFDTGNAIIVCLVFHFFQLFIDSFLASMMKQKRSSRQHSQYKVLKNNNG